MVVDYDGRILAQADPGPGEKIVVAPIDITALRHERTTRRGHQMIAHLRSEAYPMYRQTFYPPGQAKPDKALSIASNNEPGDKSRAHTPTTPSPYAPG